VWLDLVSEARKDEIMPRSLQVLLTIIALLLGCIVVGLFSRTAISQSFAASSPVLTASPTEAVSGRYQIISAGGDMNPFVYFLDTKTGNCWLAGSTSGSLNKEGWQAVPVPISPQNK
jgi:hypothetical protein